MTRKKIWIVTLCATVLALTLTPPAVAQKGETNTRSLYGQVTDKDGTPIEKAVVYLKNTKTLQIRTYIADEGGAFRFQGLSPNVDYQVHAEHEGASSPTKTISSFDTRKEVHISLKIDTKIDTKK